MSATTISAEQIWRKSRTAVEVTRHSGWREVVILLNKRMGLHYLDFSKVSLGELGLEADGAHGHQGSGQELDLALRSLDITPNDAIIDIGCGKGAAMVTMAKYPFRKIDGIDVSPEMVRIANENLSRLWLRKRTRVSYSDAATFSDLDQYTHVYFFNPFSRDIMRTVMGNLRSSLASRPRKLTILYTNPVDHEEVLQGGIFEKVSEHTVGAKAPIYTYSNRVGRESARSKS